MGKEEAIVRRLLGAERIRSVRIEPSLNDEGESVLRIYVVYDSALGDPSAEDMTRVSDEIWGDIISTGSKDISYP